MVNQPQVISHRLLDRQAVSAAWRDLTSAKVHTHFIGYMCVMEDAVAQGRNEGLHPNFKKFFDRYLRAGGLTEGFPYLKPFDGPLQNKNVAGSYAPSSLRGVAPLLEVVGLGRDDKGTTYSLKAGHVDAALRALLGGTAISGLSFAVFFYRNYGIADAFASEKGLLSLLRSDFGFTTDDEYQKLFGKTFNYKGQLF